MNNTGKMMSKGHKTGINCYKIKVCEKNWLVSNCSSSIIKEKVEYVIKLVLFIEMKLTVAK